MGELLIKPYEISVWEDKLTQDGFQEVKLAVIGSNNMSGPNKVYEPVFTKKANGEKTLSFSLKYKYFDPYSGNEEVINPFAALLINERKVKLHYDNQWYEFIVKDHTELSDELTWTYTCTDAFVLELSKNGYNIEFSADLNNNQGTARELAQKTLQNTDWRLGGVDTFKQLIEEPVYKAVLHNPSHIHILDTDSEEFINLTEGDNLYVFYSFIKNQNGKYVQFIINNDTDTYNIDSKNVVTATNYRINEELTFQNNGFYLITSNEEILILSIEEIETQFHVNRLAYGQLTTYDPVKGRTVERFKIGGDDGREVYKYSDYTYTTSTVITNYFTNGDNFNALEDGSLQGWNPYVDVDELDTVKKLQLVTRPEIGTNKELADISKISQIEGFLKATFNNQKIIDNDKIYNLIYNSGLTDNSSFVDPIATGDKFVFRWRAGTGTLDQLEPYSGLHILVAKYTQDQPTRYGYYYKHVNPEDVIIDFSGTVETLNNYITGGTLEDEVDAETELPTGKKNYVIDGVVQVASTKYIYVVGTEEYVWSEKDSDFVRYDNSEDKDQLYLPYYYMVGTATQSFSKKDLTNPEDKKKVGIFVYIDSQLTETINISHHLEPETETITNDEGEEETTVIVTKDIIEPITPIRDTTVYFTCDGVSIDFTAGGTEKIIRTDEHYTFEYNPTKETIYFTCEEGITSYTITYTSLAPVYIQDIQLTRYILDEDNKPILIGNTPVANSHLNNYYYLKPDKETTADDIITYTTPEELLDDLGATEDLIPLYNENSEKNLSISASKSNCFNILQTIAETFECWVDLVVDHDAAGKILIDDDGRARKFVYLKEYAGKDNYAGFKYGINLQSIERNINSDEIVTKLIVDLSQSDYTDEGYVSISNAPSNLSGEQYILNFDYYYNQGLLDKNSVQAEVDQLISETKSINSDIKDKEKYRRELEASLTQISAKRNLYTELVDTAQTQKTEALADFEDLTSYTYDLYRQLHNDVLIVPQEDETEEQALERIGQQLTEEENIVELFGRIYATSATINNYSGLLTNIEQEYWNVKNNLDGYDIYRVKIWVDKDELNERHVFLEFSDYIESISFTIGGETYSTSVSKKYFDISPVNDNSSIEFISFPENYHIDGQNIYSIKDYQTVTFKIVCDTTVPGVIDEIDDLIASKQQLVNNFTNKYSRFIQEGTWNSTDYIDSELYYLDALQISNTSAQPAISYTINVVEISQLDGYEWYLFDAGDKSYIEDTEFFGWANVHGVLTPAREEVIVSEVEWHLDEPDQNTITVQNYKTRFEDFFQRVNAAVQTVQYNEATYAKISTLLDANGTINQDVLLASLNRISGQQYNLTSDGSILINGDNILVRNLTNAANLVKISSEGIKISSDGGNTWATAIDGRGINIGTVYTGTLNTDNVIIGNSNSPSFRWDKAGISAYQSTGATSEIDGQVYDVYDLHTYVRYDQNGLYGIKNGDSYKPYTLDEIKDKAHFAVTWDGFFIKNAYTGGGKVQITSENDFQVINSDQTEKIKIGALEWTQDGVTTTTPIPGVAPSLYGIRINNNAGDTVFKTGDDGNLEITGTIIANAGEIGGMTVDDDQLRMDHIIFRPGVGIYSDYSVPTPFIISDTDGSAVFNEITARGHIEAQTGTLGDLDVIDTITVGSQGAIESSNWSVQNQTGWHIDDNGATFNNANVRGIITALQGDFLGEVRVGPTGQDQDHIIIDGTRAVIKSSNYQDGAGYGWMINKDGDAVFNNITARGAIKTAVFEYAEIQAVGGIFIFRPSSTIKSARINGNSLIVKVEKPALFAKAVYSLTEDTIVDGSKTYYTKGNYGYTVVDTPTGNPHENEYYEMNTQFQSWCKISNYTTDGTEPNVNNILLSNGLTHVYRVSDVNLSTAEVTLENGIQFINGVIQQDQTIADVLTGLEGGALVDMGREDGSSNYGIGVNSSDNTVNLPRRAISLFETVIDPSKSPKVSYKYKGILGTLPELSEDEVNGSIYNNQMAGTQGIYTDNMYLGDRDQYIAFYEDSNGNKQLKIKANQVMYEIVDEETGESEWKDVQDTSQGLDGEDAITVSIDSSAGNVFLNKHIQTTLTCTVTKGNGTDITNQVTRFTWTKKNADGTIDSSWSRPLAGRSITLTDADVNSKAVFVCEVEF